MMRTENIFPTLIMTQTCYYELYCKNQENFFNIIRKYAKISVQIGRHLQYSMLRLYVRLFISEMELRILNIDGMLIKISITDGRRLILHYIGILSFFLAAILKTIQNGGWDPRYRMLTS